MTFHAVASSRSLDRATKRGRALRGLIGERSLALVRDSTGAAIAFDDLCPHRGAPLSQGRIQDGKLECPYHGMRFSMDGECEVPWIQGACGLRARLVQTHEQDGLVFASFEDATPPPSLDGPCDFELETFIAAPQLEVIENFMDSTHTGFVHAGLIRSDARMSREVRVRTRADCVVVDHAPVDEELGLARRWLGHGKIAHRDTCHRAGTVEVEYFVEHGERHRFFHTLVFVTPERREASIGSRVFVRGRLTSGSGLFRALVDRIAAQLVKPLGTLILHQDRRVLEASEDAIARAGRRPKAYLPEEFMHRQVRRMMSGETLEDDERTFALRL